jgi:chemotaxis response regulator CheB
MLLNKKKPCVLVMKNDSLLKRAVVSLVISGCELDVVVSEAADFHELTGDVAKLQPDIVLLGESMPWAAKESLSNLLMTCTRLKVIVASEDSNWLHVFNKEDKLLTGLNDLISVINCG